MKIKGISFWEQNVERFILGAALLFFIAVLVMQFLMNPNVVERGVDTFKAWDVDDKLRDTAEPLSHLLAPDASSPVNAPEYAGAAEEFMRGVSRADEAVALQLPQTPRPVLFEGTTRADVLYYVPNVPAVHTALAAQYYDGLLPSFVQEHAELVDELGAAPYDVTWVTAAGRFPIKALLTELAGNDLENEAYAIPPSWYASRADIVNVLVEREEYVDGQWTGRVELDPLVGQFTFREQLADSIDRPTGSEMNRLLADPAIRTAITQPEFYPTLNESWSIPEPREDTLAAEEDPVKQEIRRLKLRLSKYLAERARAEAKLAELGGVPPASGPTGPGGATGDGGGGSGGGRAAGGGGLSAGDGGAAGGGGMTRGGGGNRISQSNRATALRLQKKIESLDKRIADIEGKLRQLEPDIQLEAAEPGDWQNIDEVLIWAHDPHDLVADAGKLYRYRFIIEARNPFFGHGASLRDTQEELAESYVIQSAPSEWTEPIELAPPLQIYITNATAVGQSTSGTIGELNLGQAWAEVYRFQDGRWWSDRFSVEPGEVIGDSRIITAGAAEPVTIDFSTEWVVLDIISDLDMNLSQISNRGKAATVLLQNLRTGEVAELRRPRLDSQSLDRDELRAQVEEADIATP